MKGYRYTVPIYVDEFIFYTEYFFTCPANYI